MFPTKSQRQKLGFFTKSELNEIYDRLPPTDYSEVKKKVSEAGEYSRELFEMLDKIREMDR